MANNTIQNSKDAVEYCILRCRWAKYKGENACNEFDYECTCKKECNDFDQFDIPEYEKHNEEHIRREVIEKACEWLYECVDTGEQFKQTLVEKFRKAIEN